MLDDKETLCAAAVSTTSARSINTTEQMSSKDNVYFNFFQALLFADGTNL